MKEDLVRNLLSDKSSMISEKNSKGELKIEQTDDLMKTHRAAQELIKKTSGSEF